MLLAVVTAAPPGRCLRRQIIGKFLVNIQSPGWIEIEDVGLLLPIVLPADIEQEWILDTECSLHVLCRALQIGEYQYASPFRDGNAGSQLPHRKRYGPIMFLYRFDYTIECFDMSLDVVGIKPPISSGHHDLVSPEHRVSLQFPGQRFGAVDTIEKPKCVLQLVAQFW